MRYSSTLGLCAFALATALPSLSLANPRPLPFTYQHEQLSKGSSEVEQFVDLTPVRARAATTGEPAWYGLVQLQTEFEHALTDRLELGLYVTLVPAVAAGFSDAPRSNSGNGMKQRLRYQLAPTGEWPIDVGIYGELAETEREIEIEGKVILQRRFGALRLVANATAEQEFYYDGTRDFVVTPSAGITYEATPAIQPGIEWWMHGEYPEKNPPAKRPFALGPHQYVGPALLLQFGPMWWTSGVYVRVSRMNHTLEPGVDGFGLLWARTIIGLGF
jgi:hypothetical protein